MRLFNTLSGQKEEFIPVEPGKVKLYACGPTVYDYIHVGNARPVILFDVLRRYMEFRGYDVTFVQNFTDVDDKIIDRANREGVPCEEITERFIAEYYTDAKGLGVREATVHPRATQHIAGMITAIETLIETGYAYATDNGDVYFRTAAFASYGALSGQNLDDLQAGARVDVNTGKENPMDFALWKSAKPDEPSWDSPWGKGRPGWHIECTVMANRFLGKTIDIHAGGQDLTFPHHENEVAQSEALNGCKFANFWMHNGFLSIDNKKMSKSLGNFFTVRDAAEAYGYDAIRMFMLMSHYRSPLNYSGEILLQAKAGLERLYNAIDNLEFLRRGGNLSPALTPQEQTFLDGLTTYRKRFIEVMDDDFNTADAIAVIFELIREVNSAIAAPATPSAPFVEGCLAAIRELTDVLGLLYAKDDGEEDLDTQVEALIAAREQARTEKNWPEADRIRDELKDMGILLEDTPQGMKWKRV